MDNDSASEGVTLYAIRPKSIERQLSLPRQNAVEVRSIHKSYGRGPNAPVVLCGVDLTVPEGAIYGLLGPSGCGKTTLLRCVVGQLKPQHGYIRVFGQQPGTAKSQVPGAAVGYMPQDIALYDDFTIVETLVYFGRLYRIERKLLAERIKFLLSFLDLPTKTRLVKNLSGGQKRRVSLAAALVHSPPLLILDEPTVGVDPLLRQGIWRHLVTLTQNEKITVLITTHYIEEARQANVVGLMRHGRLLAEASPQTLLQRHNLPTLEDVFLRLCESDNSARSGGAITTGIMPTPLIPKHQMAQMMAAAQPQSKGKSNSLQIPGVFSISNNDMNSYNLNDLRRQNSVITSSTTQLVQDESVFVPPPPVTNGSPPETKQWDSKLPSNDTFLDDISKTMAVLSKNVTRLRRNIPVLLFQFLLPAMQIILFCLCIGEDPFDLTVAVVNLEQPPVLSRTFLEKIDKHSVNLKNYTSVDDALAAVRAGEAWVALEIPPRFTTSLYKRMVLGGDVDNKTVAESTITFYPDFTNQQIGYTLQKVFLESFEKFVRDALEMAGSNPEVANLPIQMGDPVYGERSPSWTEFMAPGVITTITYFMAVGLTALAFVLERKEGLLDRSFVAGVGPIQILLAHVMTQLLVMVVQVALLLVFTFFVFTVPSKGPFIWVIILTLLQGVTGMAFGFVISALCHQETTAIMFTLGSFYPMILLCGIIWPVEAMPHYVRYVSYVLPQTLPTEALRWILSRGWDMTYRGVWMGFAVTTGWLCFFFITAAILFKVKK